MAAAIPHFGTLAHSLGLLCAAFIVAAPSNAGTRRLPGSPGSSAVPPAGKSLQRPSGIGAGLPDESIAGLPYELAAPALIRAADLPAAPIDPSDAAADVGDLTPRLLNPNMSRPDLDRIERRVNGKIGGGNKTRTSIDLAARRVHIEFRSVEALIARTVQRSFPASLDLVAMTNAGGLDDFAGGPYAVHTTVKPQSILYANGLNSNRHQVTLRRIPGVTHVQMRQGNVLGVAFATQDELRRARTEGRLPEALEGYHDETGRPVGDYYRIRAELSSDTPENISRDRVLARVVLHLMARQRGRLSASRALNQVRRFPPGVLEGRIIRAYQDDFRKVPGVRKVTAESSVITVQFATEAAMRDALANGLPHSLDGLGEAREFIPDAFTVLACVGRE